MEEQNKLDNPVSKADDFGIRATNVPRESSAATRKFLENVAANWVKPVAQDTMRADMELDRAIAAKVKAKVIELSDGKLAPGDIRVYVKNRIPRAGLHCDGVIMKIAGKPKYWFRMDKVKDDSQEFVKLVDRLVKSKEADEQRMKIRELLGKRGFVGRVDGMSVDYEELGLIRMNGDNIHCWICDRLIESPEHIGECMENEVRRLNRRLSELSKWDHIKRPDGTTVIRNDVSV